MNRPEYLKNYAFDWELLDVVLSGRSALDTHFMMSQIYDANQVDLFLKGYGLDPSDPVNRAELFGNFQESLQFIKRYFLKEGGSEGLDLKIPNSLYMITDIRDLFLMAAGNIPGHGQEERLWAEVVLKVMHTILHVDKDLRSNYFSVVQTQIFDRYYKFLHRGEDNQLFLGNKKTGKGIPLVEFETKAKKTRASVIIKLLHKAENVAEELFDRIGVRIITHSKFDNLRVVKYLLANNVIIPHNIKPSRSVNGLIDLENFKRGHQKLIRMAIRNNLTEERFVQAVNRLADECLPEMKKDSRNEMSSKNYRSIQFTCRQMIKYKNPFIQEFKEVRHLAKEKYADSELGIKLLALDLASVTSEARFFYPYEVQIVDQASHIENTSGKASHSDYKSGQKKSAMMRLFRDLIKYKNLVC